MKIVTVIDITITLILTKHNESKKNHKTRTYKILKCNRKKDYRKSKNIT